MARDEEAHAAVAFGHRLVGAAKQDGADVVFEDLDLFARDLGPGATFEADVGGVRDVRFGTRVKMHLTVERIFDARFSMTGHIGRNMAIDMGRSAVVRRRMNASTASVACSSTSSPARPSMTSIA